MVFASSIASSMESLRGKGEKVVDNVPKMEGYVRVRVFVKGVNQGDDVC